MKHVAWLLCGVAGLGAMIGIFACGKRTAAPTGPDGAGGVGANGSTVLSYGVAGSVLEPGGLGIPNAEVTVIGGAMDGRTTTASQSGYYYFTQAGDALQIRAAKSGYTTSTVNVAATRNQTNITLNPTVPYADVGGNYRVTFVASSSCLLPDDLRTRTYAAAIAQDGARLTIRFSGPQFSESTNLMEGRIYSNAVNLSIGKADDICFYYRQCFMDSVGDGRVLILDGSGSGTVAGSTLDTQVAGVVTVGGDGIERPVTCTAPDHRLTFSR